MALQIQLRRGTASEWSSANPVLAEGELGVEKDTGKFKLGDGSSQWNSLLYSSGIPGDAATVAAGTTTTGAAGSSASVVNSGNQFDAILDFTIPQGIQGVQGATGPSAIINTDGDPGQTLYVGTVDPSVDYSPVAGDVWLEVPS
jgi:hypothetical protein